MTKRKVRRYTFAIPTKMEAVSPHVSGGGRPHPHTVKGAGAKLLHLRQSPALAIGVEPSTFVIPRQAAAGRADRGIHAGTLAENISAEIYPLPENLTDNAPMRTKAQEMAGKDGDKTLRRIIWMLLSLSVLAERASYACWPVRCLVLWILRPAEAVACGFVCEVAETPLGFIDLSDFPDDNSAAGALCLAMRFTALAAALQYLLDEPQPFEGNTRQIHNAASGVRLVTRVNTKAPIGLPGSRGPPNHAHGKVVAMATPHSASSSAGLPRGGCRIRRRLRAPAPL